jgi:hypothetical protein
MGRLVLAGAMVVLALGQAHAGPTRKVWVESEPNEAAVYIDDVDKGVACTTPCEVPVPIGTVTLIVRKDGFEPEITEIDVPKGKQRLNQKIKLKSAIGTIKVDLPKGAQVRVDNEDKGKAPVDISTTSGEAHHVVVISNGRTVFDDIVEVATGDEYVVKPKTASAPPPTDTAVITEDDDDDDGDDGGSGVGSAGIVGKHPAKPREAFITGGLAFDVGFRRVTYTTPMKSDFASELSGGTQALMGPAAELWPGRLLGVGVLRGLSLFGRAQFSIVPQTVDGPNPDDDATSKWSSIELSVRQRFQLSSLVVEVSGGYVKDSFAFEAASQTAFDKMPATDYQSFRFGGRLGFASDKVEPYISAEVRSVFAAGELANRYSSSSASGLRGSAGLLMSFGMVSARVEGTLMSYSWKLEPMSSGMWPATAATDSIKLISATVGLSY